MNKQETNSALQLFTILQQLCKPVLPENLFLIPEQLMGLSHLLSQIDTHQQKLLNSGNAVKSQLENLTANNALLASASKANAVLSSQHYDDHIIIPMVRSLFPVLDLIIDAQRHWVSSQQITDLLDAIWVQFQQFLDIYDIHIISNSCNDQFNPQTTKPIKWIGTDDKPLDGLIAESLRVGFQLGTNRMLRFETVSLFKYQPNEFQTIILNERTEQC
ncbi:MAG: hypothetical protein JEZ07_19580 [Phycisphaerae bacterium]|nr:hypothetical protein [Phycisphaerae bacterium]